VSKLFFSWLAIFTKEFLLLARGKYLKDDSNSHSHMICDTQLSPVKHSLKPQKATSVCAAAAK